jgi:hypothetical protein
MGSPNLQLKGGNFQDSEGNVLNLGYLLFELSHDENYSVGPSQIVAGLKIRVLLDANGNIPLSPATFVYSNDVLTPANSFYTVRAFKADGTKAWSSSQIWILAATPNPLDVGTIVPTNPPGPGLSGSGSGIVLETNGLSNTNQSLLNLAQGTNITVSNTAGTTTISSTATSVTLETNGSANSNQALLNLAAGTNVTLANVSGTTTINASSGASFSVSGKGWFAGPGMTDLSALFVGQFNAPITNFSANTVLVSQFVLPASWKLSSVSYELGTGSAATHFNFGIYDQTGNKLIDSGAFNGAIATIQTNTFTPVTLPAGVYYFASSATSTVPRGPAMQAATATEGQLLDMINAVNPLIATAANATSGNIMPATLGVLTAATVGGGWQSVPLALWAV